ncbi:type VI secretion system tube protein Hcp [uncultured Succinivibrio sp.]|uniref:Hcp family type VI secretion system effector n=1 Tax=uncultured Succinivibrio sp. TaxID=540749 RepID=UPI0025DEBEA4|nr:type VI secretion system tube protein Hcp [uncultured Succinivibrio sp.]
MASDFFVKIDGIDGDSNDKGHSKWIELVAFSHGSVQNVGAGRATDVSGRGAFEPFTFVHLIDKATPKIQQFCMSGQKVAKVQFQVCRAVAGKQEPVYEVTLENVKISKAFVKSVVSGGNGADSLINSFQGADGAYLPLEQVELVAGKITWKYTAIKPDNTKDGAVEANFNQIENA